MEVTHLTFPTSNRLKTLVKLERLGCKSHEIGTGFLPAGCTMPDDGYSAHARHEVSIILEGKIVTYSGGKEVILQAGDIVSIPELQRQRTVVEKDTKLIYVFFEM